MNEQPRGLVQLTLAAILFGVGSLATTFAGCFGVLPVGLNVKPIASVTTQYLGIGGLLLILGAGFFGWRFYRILNASHRVERPEPERSRLLYGYHLVGVGFALMLAALMCSILFAAVAWSVGQERSDGNAASVTPSAQTGDEWNGNVQRPARPGAATLTERFGLLFGNSPEDAYFTVGLFALSTGVSLLGALFFFANALWAKMGRPERDPFDRSIFWAGLWFRLGEAVLFNLVFFLILRVYAPDRYLVLPLVSLLVGMFLKAGEALVSGVATRVFSAFAALVPTTIPSRETRRRYFALNPPKAGDEANHHARVLDFLQAVQTASGVQKVSGSPKTLRFIVEYDPARFDARSILQEANLRDLSVSVDGDGATAGFASEQRH
ncbi:MAG: hypothetical protein U1G07_13575 [Verrucomicrobiota bacterium]